MLQDSVGVGKNLQEHICYSGLTFLINQTNVGVSTNSLFNFNNFIEFFERGKGKTIKNLHAKIHKLFNKIFK